MKTITLEQLKKVAQDLEAKFSFISDFRLFVYPELKIQGGFYWMNYNNTPEGKYPFHETFIKVTEEYHTAEWLYDYASKCILKQLAWQKEMDENYAKEYNKKIEYKYDYSILEN